MSMFYELMMRKKTQIMYATIKGSLTENDGVFSGFAYNNYLVTQEAFDCSKNFDIVIKTNTGTILPQNLRTLIRNTHGVSPGQLGFAIGINGNKKINTFIVDKSGNYISNNGLGASLITENTDYFFRFSQKLNNGIYTIAIESSIDGINWVREITRTSSLPIRSSGQGIAFGGGGFSQTQQYWNGSINLNQSYIKLGSTKYKIVVVPEE